MEGPTTTKDSRVRASIATGRRPYVRFGRRGAPCPGIPSVHQSTSAAIVWARQFRSFFIKASQAAKPPQGFTSLPENLIDT